MKFKLITTEDCRYCKLAKNALDARGFDYTEETATPEIRAQLVAVGLKTVPQIYMIPHDATKTVHIGGYTELLSFFAAMEAE